MQGFGNVGSFLAKFLAEEGATVIAISDSSGGLHNPNGIDVAAALAHKQETGSLRRLARAPRRSPTRSCCCSTATCSRRARSSR